MSSLPELTRSSPRGKRSTGALSPLLVLVASNDFDHVRAVRDAVAAWPLAAWVEWAPGPLRALRRVREVRVHLVVVDAPERHFDFATFQSDLDLRADAPVPMLAFDDAAAAHAPARAEVRPLPWSALPVRLQEWAVEHVPSLEMSA